MNTMISLALLFSVAALVYAYRAYKLVSRCFSVIDSKKTRTVTIDHTDGRITVLKEEYDVPS